MDTSLLTIDIKVAGATAVRPVWSKSTPSSNLTQRFAIPPDGSFSAGSAPENIQPHFTRHLNTSSPAIDEKVVPGTTQEGQDKTKSGTQTQCFLATNPAQLPMDENIASQQQIQPTPPAEPAGLIDIPFGFDLPGVFSDSAGPAVPTLLSISTENKPIPAGIGQTQTNAVAPDVPADCIAPDAAASVSATVKTDAPDQKLSVQDKSTASGDENVFTVDTAAPIVPLNSSVPVQGILANPEKYPPVAAKSIDNKIAAGQKSPIAVVSESADSNSRKSTNNLLASSAVQKLNVTELQIPAPQTKNQSRSPANGFSDSNFDQLLARNDAQIAVTQQSSTASEAGQAAGNAYAADVSTDLTGQILESIYSSLSGGHRQITIRLNPPELGKVFIKFQEHDTHITGLLEVSSPQTQYEIEQALPQIIQNLQDSGVQIKRLEIVLAQQTDHYALADQSQPDGWFQQHNFTAYDTPVGDRSPNEWLTDNDGYQDKVLPRPQITDSSINILI